MKIKVCGMRHPENVREVAEARPDLMGFIFHPKSPRFVEDPAATEPLLDFPEIRKVGVFVDASLDEVLEKVRRYRLDLVQLHGNESPGQCAAVSGFVPVIKAFRVGGAADLTGLGAYAGTCDFFLLDSRGPAPGGNGVRFDWGLLQGYREKTPFFLSGGIGPEHLPELLTLRHPACVGIDVNSGFELAPAHKDARSLKTFIGSLHSSFSIPPTTTRS